MIAVARLLQFAICVLCCNAASDNLHARGKELLPVLIIESQTYSFDPYVSEDLLVDANKIILKDGTLCIRRVMKEDEYSVIVESFYDSFYSDFNVKPSVWCRDYLILLLKDAKDILDHYQSWLCKILLDPDTDCDKNTTLFLEKFNDHLQTYEEELNGVLSDNLRVVASYFMTFFAENYVGARIKAWHPDEFAHDYCYPFDTFQMDSLTVWNIEKIRRRIQRLPDDLIDYEKAHLLFEHPFGLDVTCKSCYLDYFLSNLLLSCCRKSQTPYDILPLEQQSIEYHQAAMDDQQLDIEFKVFNKEGKMIGVITDVCKRAGDFLYFSLLQVKVEIEHLLAEKTFRPRDLSFKFETSFEQTSGLFILCPDVIYVIVKCLFNIQGDALNLKRSCKALYNLIEYSDQDIRLTCLLFSVPRRALFDFTNAALSSMADQGATADQEKTLRLTQFLIHGCMF